MAIKKNTSQLTQADTLSPEKVFAWPQQAALDQNWGEAAQRWAVLRTVYPQEAAPWLHGALACIEAGELDQAEKLLDYSRLHFPDIPNSLIHSAELAMRRQQWKTAKTFLQQARERHPNNLQVLMKSAECAERSGNLECSIAYNEKARQYSQGNPAPYIQHAELMMNAKHWEEALECWKYLREHFQAIPAAYIRAAEAARQLGRPKEARQMLLALQYGSDIFDGEDFPAKSPKLRGNHLGLGQMIELIWVKAIFNLRSEVHRNYLSYGWWVLEPLLYLAIYYIVFGMLLNRGGENYPVFLLTGLIPWMWFMKAVNSSSTSILAGQNLLLQVGLPPIIFPLVNLLQTTLKQLPVFILLFCFIWLLGYSPNVHWWALLPVIFVQVLLTTVVACTVAAIIPFIRDISYLVPTGLTFLMFLSGIFYDYRTIPAGWQDIFLLNPIAFLLKCYREIFIDGVQPDLTTLTYWGVGGATTCLLLTLIYKYLRYTYPRVVME